MSVSKLPEDQAVRVQSLDPSASCIIQAPAGSGKTGLLIQRYLRLLSVVSEPEEIIAITFTRKAAGEMRQRILSALHESRGDAPEEPHRLKTYALACEAMDRSRECGWSLDEFPARMRIQTIDSLCISLARQLPWLSGFGGVPAITEDASYYYHQASVATIQLLEEGGPWGDAAADLLLHMDNNVPRLSTMLSLMLSRRDQWLHRLMSPHNDADRRRSLEAALERAVTGVLQQLAALIPPGIKNELAELAACAGRNLKESASASAIVSCSALEGLPGTDVTAVRQWQGLAELLLTDKDNWRKQCNKSLGFPPGKGDAADMKQRMASVYAVLSDHDELREQLAMVRILPVSRYTDEQWDALRALVVILPVAAAQLRLVFMQHGQVDFIEVSAAALRALGDPDNPTDLSLALDYRIQHILLDEFQDTSYSQYSLLECLTAGWVNGDGRSLFLVGDPMQSIYRFRQAEVSLFLRAWEQGIGTLQLTPLKLSVNFRASSRLVEWINETFSSVLPEKADISSAAVPYSESYAWHDEGPSDGVTVHGFLDSDMQCEADRIVELVKQAQQQSPADDIAILVRSRGHLKAILPTLKRKGLRFCAIDLDPLDSRAVIQDLLSITLALLHPAERTAWLAVLRAPWCALTLSDMVSAFQHDRRNVWEIINDENKLASLSEEGRNRVGHVRDAFQNALDNKGRVNLRRWVEGLWISLGGPACVNATDIEDARVYFSLLDELSEGCDLREKQALLDKVATLRALPDMEMDGVSRLHIMSIHKAKGLEFDMVIIPGMSRRPRPDDSPLLAWSHRAAGPHASDVLLAPVHAFGAEKDPVYRFIQALEKTKSHNETARLLYVAITRAKRRCHLLGYASPGKDGDALRRPLKNTFLEMLWDRVQTQFDVAGNDDEAIKDDTENESPAVSLFRLPATWERPVAPLAVEYNSGTGNQPHGDEIEFEWVGDMARHVGSVVHRYLRLFAEQGLAHWDIERIESCRPSFRALLLFFGVTGRDIDAATNRVVESLSSVLQYDRSGWLFYRYRESANELPLTGVLDNNVINVVLDRTFVDNNDVRWIIDYKASRHEGGGLEDFLDQEADRYKNQLQRYARLMALQEDRSIRLGLYFPLVDGWREWEY
ncbi:MAG: UvrD-helicase domain-containing protein [Gammaproteobacteria bacterium]|nr:MAG: UvrD-helicase domain-containing protein [Gammaproteobacteria bacterium]